MGIKLWMVFEAVAAEKADVEESLEDHVDAMKSEDDIDIIEIEKDETERMEDPHPSLDEGYSQVLEMRAEFGSFPKAVETVINYGPTYVQVEGPDSYTMDLAESQESLQSVAKTMHKYAQMGAGGVLISKAGDEN
ncbi:MAG: hypothetical protein H8Z69_03565 [Nanohaloarchaea archaeon]|nr:hypothetical protein [Candidatus Nanohaloarchaea archaeon]